jgi:hypothetical protein
MVDSVPCRTAFQCIVGALLLGVLLGASAARANDMGKTNALLKAGSYPQVLERVNEAVAAKPQHPRVRFY